MEPKQNNSLISVLRSRSNYSEEGGLVAGEYLADYFENAIIQEHMDLGYLRNMCYEQALMGSRSLTKPGWMHPALSYDASDVCDDLFTEAMEILAEVNNDVTEALNCINSISFKRTSRLLFSTGSVIMIKTQW